MGEESIWLVRSEGGGPARTGSLSEALVKVWAEVARRKPEGPELARRIVFGNGHHPQVEWAMYRAGDQAGGGDGGELLRAWAGGPGLVLGEAGTKHGSSRVEPGETTIEEIRKALVETGTRRILELWLVQAQTPGLAERGLDEEEEEWIG